METAEDGGQPETLPARLAIRNKPNRHEMLAGDRIGNWLLLPEPLGESAFADRFLWSTEPVWFAIPDVLSRHD